MGKEKEVDEFAKKSVEVFEKILKNINEPVEEIFGLNIEDREKLLEKLVEIYFSEKLSDAVDKAKEISKNERETAYMLFTLFATVIVKAIKTQRRCLD